MCHLGGDLVILLLLNGRGGVWTPDTAHLLYVARERKGKRQIDREPERGSFVIGLGVTSVGLPRGGTVLSCQSYKNECSTNLICKWRACLFKITTIQISFEATLPGIPPLPKFQNMCHDFSGFFFTISKHNF